MTVPTPSIVAGDEAVVVYGMSSFCGRTVEVVQLLPRGLCRVKNPDNPRREMTFRLSELARIPD